MGMQNSGIRLCASGCNSASFLWNRRGINSTCVGTLSYMPLGRTFRYGNIHFMWRIPYLRNGLRAL